MKIQIAPERKGEEQYAEAFAALAHVSRIKVFFYLVRAKREVAVGSIQKALNIPGPTLTHHLSLLRLAGLVQCRKEERFVYYWVNQHMVSELVRVLTACC